MTDLTVGSTIDGRYVLRREVARGGMCTVFAAEHLYTGRSVALKMLNPEHARNEAIHLRLLREAKALELARHPNVVEVLDAGKAQNGQPFLAMEMLEGRTLDGVLATRQKLPVIDVVNIGGQICAALAWSHARGVVHRDLKPSNIMLCHDVRGQTIVKLIDYSIAFLRPVSESQAAQPKITKLGEILGTPEYMAPEQLQLLDTVDTRSDLYSTAVLLFECLTGSVPYPGTYGDVFRKISTMPIPSVAEAEPEVSEELAAVITQGLAREPEARFADALAFGRALVEAYRDGVESQRASRASAMPVTASVPPELSDDDIPLIRTSEVTAAQPRQQAPSRRRFAREPYVTPVRLVLSDQSTLDGRSEDISEGGLLVITNQSCGNNELGEVRFAIPLTGKMVKVAVTTRWVRDARGRSALGLEFTNLPEPIQRDISQYIKLMERPRK